jgi:nucleoside-diphosphate-sugar epimerase
MPAKTVVTINSSGRQAASFIRCAAAIGWKVRAQMKDSYGIVAQDIMSRDNVEVIEGSLSDHRVIDRLFEGGADMAFINTTPWGNEVAIGKALADAAKRAGVRHLIYSSMPDHSTFNRDWKALPLWASKFAVENYIRQVGLPATFVYCGIYHNNFTSLPYPLFRMALQDDGSFVWQAPFDRNQKLPWLDAEQDVGPAVLNLFEQGPMQWGGKR